ncbi:hypothetical protein [Cellulomonas xiejunii]|uniref:Uncharacterized protein n=1 Tax=Cellulomonas xiejunii TaxID=2968083 RepID=A0ABY5KPM4_9CELL|nr:hypothetical protein [Cellulomonas xiejunii]MCC2322281.1 hypothetical protein [Cellulomonas xiejunii]UUI72335.1 hypothetical protein NP048_02370 [Cellulomonas xiejunii]
MTENGVVTASTDAGMLALWCASTFDRITDYDTWESELYDRLDAAISGGELVPINIGSDGAYGVRIAVAPDVLSERESRHAWLTSDPYLLVVTGEEAALSGIEHVGDPEAATARVPLAAGRYQVRVTVVDWDQDPESVGSDGRPTANALPDFVVQVVPESGRQSYRASRRRSTR